MDIKVEINSCQDCRHLDHSGAFTPGGARDMCGHKNSVECFASHIEGDKKYDCRHRYVDKTKIPDKCPLKKGCKY